MQPTFLDPGQMTARLDLDAADDRPDGQGGIAPGWKLLRSLWACIEPLSQHAYERGHAEGVTITHRIWLGFRTDIAAGMRFRKGGRVFAVKAVADPDETGRFIVCTCAEESL